MAEQSKAFLDALADCEVECQEIIKALHVYSDSVKDPVDQKFITHAIAWRNGLSSYRKVIELVTKYGTEPEPEVAPECSIKPPAPECSVKPPTQQCSI